MQAAVYIHNKKPTGGENTGFGKSGEMPNLRKETDATFDHCVYLILIHFCLRKRSLQPMQTMYCIPILINFIAILKENL